MGAAVAVLLVAVLGLGCPDRSAPAGGGGGGVALHTPDYTREVGQAFITVASAHQALIVGNHEGARALLDQGMKQLQRARSRARVDEQRQILRLEDRGLQLAALIDRRSPNALAASRDLLAAFERNQREVMATPMSAERLASAQQGGGAGGAPAANPQATKPQPKVAPETKPQTATKTAAKPNAKTAANTNARTAAKPKTATKPDTKTATKSNAKTAAKTAAKPNAKTTTKPSIKTAAKPGTKTAAKPGTKTAAKPGTKMAAKPSTKTAARIAAAWPIKPQPARKGGPDPNLARVGLAKAVVGAIHAEQALLRGRMDGALAHVKALRVALKQARAKGTPWQRRALSRLDTQANQLQYQLARGNPAAFANASKLVDASIKVQQSFKQASKGSHAASKPGGKPPKKATRKPSKPKPTVKRRPPPPKPAPLPELPPVPSDPTLDEDHPGILPRV